jgi:hypothetical protein
MSQQLMAIPLATIERIVNILSQQPYNQVADVIAEIQRNIRPIEQEQPDE